MQRYCVLEDQLIYAPAKHRTASRATSAGFNKCKCYAYRRKDNIYQTHVESDSIKYEGFSFFATVFCPRIEYSWNWIKWTWSNYPLKLVCLSFASCPAILRLASCMCSDGASFPESKGKFLFCFYNFKRRNSYWYAQLAEISFAITLETWTSGSTALWKYYQVKLVFSLGSFFAFCTAASMGRIDLETCQFWLLLQDAFNYGALNNFSRLRKLELLELPSAENLCLPATLQHCKHVQMKGALKRTHSLI